MVRNTVTWNGRIVEKRDPVRTSAAGSTGRGGRGGQGGRGGFNNIGYGRTGPGFNRNGTDGAPMDLSDTAQFPPLNGNTGGAAPVHND